MIIVMYAQDDQGRRITDDVRAHVQQGASNIADSYNVREALGEIEVATR